MLLCCCALLCCVVLCCAVLCCDVLCCVVLCCVLLYCVVLYCTVLCCAVFSRLLCCVVLYCTNTNTSSCILDKLDFFFSLTGFTMGGKYRNIPAIIPGIIFILLPFVGEHIFKSAYYCKDVETF